MIAVLAAVVSGAAGVILGAWLQHRNARRSATERLLVEALNDALAAISEVANVAGPQAQARYASAVARIALHGSPTVVKAFRDFQEIGNTTTETGRSLLLDALGAARAELGRAPIDRLQAATLLFGATNSPRETTS